jgi:hypothetical protein
MFFTKTTTVKVAQAFSVSTNTIISQVFSMLSEKQIMKREETKKIGCWILNVDCQNIVDI